MTSFSFKINIFVCIGLLVCLLALECYSFLTKTDRYCFRNWSWILRICLFRWHYYSFWIFSVQYNKNVDMCGTINIYIILFLPQKPRRMLILLLTHAKTLTLTRSGFWRPGVPYNLGIYKKHKLITVSFSMTQ